MGSDGSLPCPTIVDLEMLDSTAAAERRRPSLSTSLSDFALFPSSSSAPSSPSSASTPQDDGVGSPFFRRFRRSSILAAHPIIADFDIKPSSPLAMSSLTAPQFSFSPEKMMAEDSSSNSNNKTTSSSRASAATPSFLFDHATTSTNVAPPSTPPRSGSSSSTLTVDPPENPLRRRFSLPPKPARLLDLRSELRSPIDSELKSEAQFQRLLASYSYAGSPFSKRLPRTARAWADRGRYPEEAGGDDDYSSADTASDEGEEELASIGASAGANASVTGTPSGSTSGCGEDQAMTIDTAIVGPFMMDVDIPSVHSAVSSPTQWRQTPPPTSSGVRATKRKLDDRYDPYPNVAKRRAVSPSVHGHHLHSHSHPHLHSHHHRPRSGSISTTPPISIPVPHSRSVTSSPILRPTSSPILRPTSFPGNSSVFQGKSPTIRPLARLTMRNGSDTERERERSQRGVDGAGEAVSSLSIT